MGNFIIYTYGDGQVIYNILMSISAFFGGGVVVSLVKLAGITAILIFVTNAVGITARGNINQPLDYSFFIKFYLAYAILVMTPVSQVIITDNMTNQNYVVKPSSGGKIPLGVVIVNAYMSSFFNTMINVYQEYFETGSSGNAALSYAKSGMAFGSNFLANAPTYTSGSPVYDQNLETYMTQCALPVEQNNNDMQNFMATDDIVGYMFNNFPTAQQSRFVQIVDPTSGIPTIETCWQAITNINKEWTNNSSVYQYLANGAGFGANMLSSYNTAANITPQFLMNAAYTQEQFTKQAIAMNLLYNAIQTNAQRTGNTSSALSVYDAQQWRQYQQGGELSGELAARIVPALKLFAEMLTFMFYPFVVFYCLLSMSFIPFLKYIKIVATVQAIPFVYEILNSGLNLYAADKTSQIATMVNVTNTSGIAGFSLTTAGSIFSINSSVVAAAHYLSMSAPALAYMLISGSDMAITQVFGHITSPGQGISASQGTEMAKGNTSLGSTNMDTANYNNLTSNNLNQRNNTTDNTNRNSTNEFNYTGYNNTNHSKSIDNDNEHHHDTAPTNKHGVATDTTVTPSGNISNVGGTTVVSSIADQQKLGMNLDYSSAAQEQVSNMKNQLTSLQGNNSKTYQQVVSDNHSVSSGSNSQITKAFDNNKSMSNDYTHSQALAANIKAGLSAAGSGASMSTEARSTLNQNIKELSSIAEKYSHISDSAVKDAFSHLNSFASSSQETATATWTTQAAETKLQTHGEGLKITGNDAFVQWAKGQGYSGQDIADMSHSANGKSQEQLLELGNKFAGHWLQSDLGDKTNYSVSKPDETQALKNINSSTEKYLVVPKDTTISSETLVNTAIVNGRNKVGTDSVPTSWPNSAAEMGKDMVQTGDVTLNIATGGGVDYIKNSILNSDKNIALNKK